MDITKALETGNIGYILIAFGAISMIVLWRHNVFLTNKILEMAEKMNQAITDLRIAILTKKD